MRPKEAFCQKRLIQASFSALGLDGEFFWDSFEHVEGSMFKNGKVKSDVFIACAGKVVVERNVHNPVKIVASRPKESHLRPLSERNRILSHHSAPIRQTHLSYGVTSVRTDVDRFW